MLIEKRYDGAWIISEVIKGFLVTRCYIGYTKKEAKEMFKKDARREKP